MKQFTKKQIDCTKQYKWELFKIKPFYHPKYFTAYVFLHYVKSQTLINTLSQTPFPFVLFLCLSLLSVCLPQLCFSLTLMCHTCPLSHLRLYWKRLRRCAIIIKSLRRAALLSLCVCEGVHI